MSDNEKMSRRLFIAARAADHWLGASLGPDRCETALMTDVRQRVLTRTRRSVRPSLAATYAKRALLISLAYRWHSPSRSELP